MTVTLHWPHKPDIFFLIHIICTWLLVDGWLAGLVIDVNVYSYCIGLSNWSQSLTSP